MIEKTQCLVVTRPLNQAGSLVQMLNQYSATENKLSIAHLPLVQINAVQINESSVSKLEAIPFDGVIFISPNAVNYAASQLLKKQWTDLNKRPLYAIGSSTAETLKIASSESSIKIPKQMNSEGLLELPDLNNIANQDWLIVKGLGGREKLKNILIERGAVVTEVCTYERIMPPLDTISKVVEGLKEDAIWIVTSVHAIKNLHNIRNQIEENLNCRVIVSSGRIKKAALKLGFNVIAVAKDATDQPLMNCIRELKL